MWERLVVALYRRTPERPRRAVVRLFTPSYRVGALAVLRRPDGRVLLVDQPYVEGWALPGGDLKRGETVAAGLARELREELGLDVPVAPPVLAHQRAHDRWVTFVTTFTVPDAVADGLAPRSAELSRLGWFDPDALPSVHPDAAPPLHLALGSRAAVGPAELDLPG